MRAKAMGLLLCLYFFSASVSAEDSRWSMMLGYGQFAPGLIAWRSGYDDRHMPGWQMSVAYKPVPVVDVGLGLGYFSAAGVGFLPLNNAPGGAVTYTVYPFDVYASLQAKFSAEQWLVPYMGGGYTLFFYQIDIKGQADREGKAEGVHYNFGLRFSLNKLDAGAARRLQQGWGIERTQLIVDVKKYDVTKLDADLGGDIYSLGLLFEF